MSIKKQVTKKTAPPKAVKPLTPAQKIDAVGEDAIMEMVAEAVFYGTIAKQCGVSTTALMNWLGAREEMYARAKEARADKLAEDILSISDECEVEAKYDGEDVELRLDATAVARNRLRVDARKWLAAKMLPKKYGDKLEVEGTMKTLILKDLSGQ